MVSSLNIVSLLMLSATGCVKMANIGRTDLMKALKKTTRRLRFF